ncbi:MAG: hypothetical protein R6X19_01975 [Kiritimatiellia bacterium]
MPLKRTILLSFLATALVWLVFAWPLPRYAATGIPSSAHNIERENVRRMIVGDHLQFHYFYWLFSDMLAGRTPLFENRYEFNTGNDAERYNPGSYNLPLSLAYAAVRPLTGRALAWNAVLFLSLWLTVLWTWLALRGLLPSARLTGLMAACAIAFPFRWVMLFGGSPTGPAMMWPALLAFGFSLALREGRPIGGLWAALALLGAYINDRHVFFFSFLALPALAVLFLLLRDTIPWRTRAFRQSLLLAAVPLALAVLILGGLAARTTLGGFADTSLEGGRTLDEVNKFAPFASGLIAWGGRGRDAHVYLGWLFFAIAALHLGAIWRNWGGLDARERRRSAAGLLLWLGAGGVILLALGPKGPGDGTLFDFVRAHVPGSKALRQPAKIFCLFTILLPFALTTACLDLRIAARGRRFLLVAAGALPLLLVADYALQIHPSICLLDTDQPAYAAVAEDARTGGQTPRAVIVPLWPGDSDWAAVYQHYVSLYRIRMLNGYRPVVPNAYRKLVREFSSLNSGQIDGVQADALLARGFHYVLLHEDAFPEKISPFPVIFTRNRLLDNPRLALLKQGENVWAFKILPAPRPVPARPPAVLFPARFWEFEKSARTNVADFADAAACNGAYTRLTGIGSVSGRGFRVTGVADPALLLRLRGKGALQMRPTLEEPALIAARVDKPDWTWFRLPLDSAREAEFKPVFTVSEGSVDADFGMLIAGTWTPPEPGTPTVFPADWFFHAGWSDPDTGAVHLRPDYEAADFVFYGPRLPFKPGPLLVEIEADSTAKKGTPLGRVAVDGMGVAWGLFPLKAGEPFKVVVTNVADRPISVNFQYRRRAPMTIRNVTITPLPAGD